MTEVSTRVSSFYQHTPSEKQYEDEIASQVSTIKWDTKDSKSSSGSRSFCFVNRTSFAPNDNLMNDDFDSASDDLNYEDDSVSLGKPTSYTRVSSIDVSPEMEKKRKEAYEKWLSSVKARDRERKRMQKEREEAFMAKKLEEEERKKAANDEKVKEWMKKKESEAQKKLTRLNELKKRSSDVDLKEKTKDFKKAIDFKQWLERKNDEHKVQKRIEEERKKLQKDYRVCRESTSAAVYSKWKESSKNTPKPVPMNRGLESLRGSTTKIFINPIEWKSLDS